MADGRGRVFCVFMMMMMMMVIAQARESYSLETSSLAAASILSLCQSESSRTSSESIVIFHPVHKTYNIVHEDSHATFVEMKYLHGTGKRRKRLAKGESPSQYYRTKEFSSDSTRRLNLKTVMTKNEAYRSSSYNILTQDPKEQDWRDNRIYSNAPKKDNRIRSAEFEFESESHTTRVFESVGIILEKEKEYRPLKTRRYRRRNGGVERRKRRTMEAGGSVCSCSIRPEDNVPVPMSVMVTFYRLDTDTGNNTRSPDLPTSTHGPRVKCPKLSLTYNGSKVQPLACLGLESKSVTSFRLPPIRLSRLGIKLERESEVSETSYYAAFVVNVTVPENTRLVSSCNHPSDLNSTNASGIKVNSSSIPESTTVGWGGGGEGGDPRGTSEIMITGVSPSGALMNNEQGEKSHGITAAFTTRKGHNPGEIGVTGSGDTMAHASPSSSPSLLSSSLSSASSSSSSSTSSSLSSPTRAGSSWHGMTTALTGNGSSVVVAAPSGKLDGEKDNDDDDDSSRTVLVAVLTSLTVTSILVGLVFYLCRIRRLRNDETKDESPTGHNRVRPYRVISLSRLLHRVSSRGTRTRTRTTNDPFNYSPGHSPRDPTTTKSKTVTDINSMNNEGQSRLAIGRITSGRHCREDNVTLAKCDRNIALSFLKNNNDNNNSNNNKNNGNISNIDIDDLSKQSDRNVENNSSGNSTAVNNSVILPKRLERVGKARPSDSINTLDKLQMAPPVPPRRRQNNGEQVVTKQQTKTTTPSEGRDLGTSPKPVERREKQKEDGEVSGIQSTHTILPITGVRLPYSNQTTTRQGESGGEILEDTSEGKYSIARETRSIQIKRKSLGRLFEEFWSSKVFRRKKKRHMSEDSMSTSPGYWRPGDIGRRTLDDASSDGYESYVEKYDSQLSYKGRYRSYDSCDNYEVAKVYIHDENQEYESRPRFPYGSGRSDYNMHDFESISDGYDNFMIAQECENPECERSRKDFSKNSNNVESYNGLGLNSREFASHQIINKNSRETGDDLGDADYDEAGIFSRSRNSKDKKMEHSSSTIKYAEPKVKPRKNINKRAGNVEDGFYRKQEQNSMDMPNLLFQENGKKVNKLNEWSIPRESKPVAMNSSDIHGSNENRAGEENMTYYDIITAGRQSSNALHFHSGYEARNHEGGKFPRKIIQSTESHDLLDFDKGNIVTLLSRADETVAARGGMTGTSGLTLTVTNEEPFGHRLQLPAEANERQTGYLPLMETHTGGNLPTGVVDDQSEC